MRVLLQCIAVTMTTAAVGCDEQVPYDDYTDVAAVELWCGSSLCDWNLERGFVWPMPTWHRDDPGVAIGDDTAIKQVMRRFGYSSPAPCFRVDLVANVVPTAALQLKVDVHGDGTVEQIFDLPAGTWAPAEFLFAVKAPFNRIDLEIVKNGSGFPSILARLRAAQVFEQCEGVEPLDGGPAPLGAACRHDADCATPLCSPGLFAGVCSTCDPERSMCPDGQICGLSDATPNETYLPFSCVAPAARVLTEPCHTDAECASGLCVYGVCSTCRTDADCNGVPCTATIAHDTHLCGLGQRLGQRGDPCVDDLDCASSRCRGLVRRECSDHRACVSDAECPDDLPRYAGECKTVGIKGGVCD